jgi:hypothetical protein
MFDSNAKIFCQRYLRQDGVMIRQGTSFRYSVMSFLGLLEYERSGGRSPIPLQASIDQSGEDECRWTNVDNIGDLGLLLWLCAKAAPEQLQNVYRSFTIETALDRYDGAHEGNTMELSWFLTGLSYAAVSPASGAANWRAQADKTYAMLRKNQGRFGFFGHSASHGTLAVSFAAALEVLPIRFIPFMRIRNSELHSTRVQLCWRRRTALPPFARRRVLWASGGGITIPFQVIWCNAIPCIPSISTRWRRWR